MNTDKSQVLLAVLVGWVIVQPGCSRSPSPAFLPSQASVPRRMLSAGDAARLAAQLANDQCEQRYQKRPFAPEQHSATLTDGLYCWGGLDVGGPGGFSALVTFREDGTEPHVEVYFSSDALRLQKRPAVPADGAPKIK